MARQRATHEPARGGRPDPDPDHGPHSREHPAWGCVRLYEWIKPDDLRVSGLKLETVVIDNGWECFGRAPGHRHLSVQAVSGPGDHC